MSDTIIAGVDFSGAKEQPNNTYMAFGTLAGSTFELSEIRKVGSHLMAQELTKHEGLTVVGMDFPFSLPMEFLEFWAEKAGDEAYQEWQQVAEKLIFSSFEQFSQLATEFKKEPKRICDKASAKPAQSPLHRGYPSMIQMTFQGIRLLASLNPEKFAVQPFQDLALRIQSVRDSEPVVEDSASSPSEGHGSTSGSQSEIGANPNQTSVLTKPKVTGSWSLNGPHSSQSAPGTGKDLTKDADSADGATESVKSWFDQPASTNPVMPLNHKCAVLEVYPRASLHAFGLPDTGYKAKDKNDEGRAQSQRVHLLRDLIAFPSKISQQDPKKFSRVPKLLLSPKLEQVAVQTDHGLDAVLACYTSALWYAMPHLFQDPFAMDQIEILLEGWIYTPRFVVDSDSDEQARSGLQKNTSAKSSKKSK